MHQLFQNWKVGEVAPEVMHQTTLFPELVEGLFQNNPNIRMRASDALEKATKDNAEHLLPFKNRLLALAKKEEQIEVRLKGELLVHIEELTVTGTPAMKARGRKLLAKHQATL